jgi:hypothetical protein
MKKTTHAFTQKYPQLGLVVVALLLALALAACGGDDTSEAAETAVVAPTDAAETSTTEPATAPPATETMAPETPPTDEPTAEPATEAPAETEPATAAGGGCSNAYYPVVDGRVYTYSSSIAGFGVSNFTMTFSDVTDSSFTVTTDAGEGEPIAITWECNEEGLFSPEFTQFPGGEEFLTIEFVEAEGVTVPAEELFQPGESWTTHYVANATMGEAGVGEMTLVQTMDMTHTVIGTEAVSVPAGDYPDAVRVDTVGTVSISFSLGGTAQPATSTEMNYTNWYVRDVGMVRQEFEAILGVEGADDPSVTELLSFE